MKPERCLIILIPGFPENEEDSTCLPSHQAFVKSVNRVFPELELQIISFQYPYERSSYQWYNNSVTSFGGRNRGGLARRLLWNRVMKKLSQLKKEKQVIGILSFWAGECAWVGHRWAKRNGIRHRCLLMGRDAQKINHFIHRIKPDQGELVSISDFNADWLYEDHGIRPAHIIPLGVEPAIFQQEPVQRDIDILCAGSLIPLKQFHYAIELASEWKKTFPDLRMVICGSGWDENSLRSLVASKELDENIEFTGEKKYMDVIRLMQRSKLFLHPSSYEGFSGVCLEARAAGTPVVSFIKPMKEDIPGWHIVQTKQEMQEKCSEILRSGTDYRPIFPYTSDEAARRFIALFH